MYKKIYFLSVIIVITGLSAFGSEGDSLLKGMLSGKIIDIETRQPVPGATIRLINTKIGTVSDKNGNYNIKNTPIGRYSVSANIIGYEHMVLTDIIVVTKRTTVLDFELKISPVQMKEIVVNSETYDGHAGDITVSMAKINNEEIRMTPGTPDIFRRLQFMPGVGRTGENSSALIVRGGDPEESLTLIENLEVFSPFHFSDMSGEIAGSLSIIEPKLVDNISISTGGFSPAFGDKLSSVTQIKLKEPEKNRINGDVSVDMAGLSAFASGPVTNNVSWLVAGRRGILDWLMKMMDLDFTPITTDFHAKLLFEPSNAHKISIYGIYADDIMEGTHEDGTSEKKTWFTGLTKSQWSFGANWRWLFSEKGYLLVTPYGNLNKWDMKNGIMPKKDAFENTNIQNFYGLKAETFYRLTEIHRLSAGFEYKYINAEYSKKSDWDTLSDERVIMPYFILFGPEDTYKPSAFIQYLVTPVSWFNLNLGIRGDYFGYTGEITYNPRVSGNLLLIDRLTLSMAAGIFTQFPEFYRIFSSKENEKLKAARAVHYIAGLDYVLSTDIQLKLEGYYKSLSKLPVRLNDTSNVFTDNGSGYSYGIEFSAIKKMSDDLYIFLNYTYSVSRRRDSANGSLYNFRYDRPQMLNIMATYKLGNWWEFGLTLGYSTGFPYTPYDLSTRRQVNGVWYCDLGGKNSERYPDYFRMDLKVERRFVFESWNLRTYLEIWNLTNHENFFQYNYSDGYAKKEGEVLFPFMPMLGVAIEF